MRMRRSFCNLSSIGFNRSAICTFKAQQSDCSDHFATLGKTSRRAVPLRNVYFMLATWAVLMPSGIVSVPGPSSSSIAANARGSTSRGKTAWSMLTCPHARGSQRRVMDPKSRRANETRLPLGTSTLQGTLSAHTEYSH